MDYATIVNMVDEILDDKEQDSEDLRATGKLTDDIIQKAGSEAVEDYVVVSGGDPESEQLCRDIVNAVRREAGHLLESAEDTKRAKALLEFAISVERTIKS
jgi:organic radical activating enzyme